MKNMSKIIAHHSIDQCFEDVFLAAGVGIEIDKSSYSDEIIEVTPSFIKFLMKEEIIKQ